VVHSLFRGILIEGDFLSLKETGGILMKTNNTILLGVITLMLAVGAYGISSHVEMEMATDAIAASATSAQSAACTDPTAAAFMPAVDYTITWSTPSASTAASASATAVLTTEVNADTSPIVTATLNGTNVTAGHVLLNHTTPKLKMAGLQCQAVSGSKLEAHGDDTDNTNITIALSNLADDDTTYTSGDQVDDALSTMADVIFGTAGQISVTDLADGSDDDSSTNGDIVFGTSESAGGTETKIMVNVTNYDVAAGTDLETLTFKLTAS
jgi:hypothetical protein